MIEDEVAYVERATRAAGQSFLDCLRTKGFVDHEFQHHWATVTEIVNRYGLGPRVLDLGCGPGWTSLFLAGRGFRVTGVDVAPSMIDIARENAARFGLDVDFRVGEMQAGFTIDAPFDTVLVFDALHHCPDERAVLEHCFRALRPGGKLLLVEPDWFHAYSPDSRHASREYGTTERGLGYRRVRRALKSLGFSRIRRFYSPYHTCTAGPFDRCRALGIVLLTLTCGYPKRPMIVLAEKPE